MRRRARAHAHTHGRTRTTYSTHTYAGTHTAGASGRRRAPLESPGKGVGVSAGPATGAGPARPDGTARRNGPRGTARQYPLWIKFLRAASITAVTTSPARVVAAAPGCVVALGRLALPRPARAWARRRLASAGSGPLGFADSPRAPALLSHRSIRWLPPAKRSRTEQDESGGRLLRADGRAILAPTALL